MGVTAVRRINGPVAIPFVAASLVAGWLATSLGNQAVTLEEWTLVIAGLALLLSSAAVVHRVRLLGFFLGLYVVGNQILARTLDEPGLAIYGMSAIAAGVSWLTTIGKRRLGLGNVLRDPLFLVGIASWLPGLLGPVIAGAWLVEAERVIQVGVLLAIFLAVRKHADPIGIAWGLVAGTSLTLLFVTTCGLLQPLTLIEQALLFTSIRTGALAGGHCAVLHPNLIAIFAFALSMCWLALPGARALARVGGLTASVLLLLLAESRTGVAAAVLGFAVWAATRRRTLNQRYSGGAPGWLTARSAGAVVVAVFLAVAGYFVGQRFFQQERVRGLGALTGRELIWQASVQEVREAGNLGLLLGQVNEANMEVELPGALAPVRTHNAGLDIVGRAGVLGLVIALAGLLSLLWRYLRVLGHPGWGFSSAVVFGSVATSIAESFLLGSLFVWVTVADSLGGKVSEIQGLRSAIRSRSSPASSFPR